MDTKRVVLLGNFSGRNAGDNAILGNILRDLHREYPDWEFWVPTLRPNFVRQHFKDYPVRPVGLMPWNCSLKILGLPTARAVLGADLVLITDNILFDFRFFNPLFNYLSTISLLAPLCKLLGIPVVLYNASVGPISSRVGLAAIQRILSASSALVLRDEQSEQFLRQLDTEIPEIVRGADSALNTVPAPPSRIDTILSEIGIRGDRPILGFNVNAYGGLWLKDSSLETTEFEQIAARALDRCVDELNVEVLFVVTQVMDRRTTQRIISRMIGADRPSTLSVETYAYEEIAGVFKRLRLHIGLRTHSLILASSVGTPVVNINVYPKSHGFMRTIGQEEWSIEYPDVTERSLFELIQRAWVESEVTAATVVRKVAAEKARALLGVQVVGRILDPAHPESTALVR